MSPPDKHSDSDASLPEKTFFVLGPTASGKSAVALGLAEHLGGEVVNADAFQLFGGLDVLTASPTTEERSRLPHHLYGVLDLNDSCDAQRYRELALPVLREIADRGKVPVVVGGSGLYIKSLTHGMDPLPAGDPDLRALLARRPLEDKVQQLLELDPEAQSTVPLENPRYVERALEICLLSGRPQSELKQRFRQPSTSARGVCLSWERDALYERINQRVLRMLEEGALEEVRRAGTIAGGAAKAIGFSDLRAVLEGGQDLDTAVEAIQQASRRYAKRQRTWFRRETWLQTICLDSDQTPDSVVASILPHV